MGKGGMAETLPPTVYALVNKRAETVGQINYLQEQLGKAMANLDHLDATIRIFAPDIDLSDAPVKPVPPPNAAFRGEVQRFLLHELRTNATALTTLELARKIMEARGLDTRDKVLSKLIGQRTGHSLGKLRSRGLVTAEKANAGGLLRWQLTRAGDRGEPVGGWRNGSTSER
jgi:hypothetical protein